MAGLRTVSASQGVMLESLSARLCEPGGVHYGSPDKRPEARLTTAAKDMPSCWPPWQAVPAETPTPEAPVAPAAIEYLQWHHHAGKPQLDRDFYWQQHWQGFRAVPGHWSCENTSLPLCLVIQGNYVYNVCSAACRDHGRPPASGTGRSYRVR
jgi:hypothetical protein